MKVQFVYKVFPVIIRYVDKVGKDTSSFARSYGPLVLVEKAYKEDEPLLAHELEHSKQWYRTLGIHSILYKLWMPYRMEAEVAAYRVQLAEQAPINRPNALEYYAKTLAEKYNLDVDIDEARSLIGKGLV